MSAKKEKINMLEANYTSLCVDAREFREECKSDIYDGLATDVEFECMSIVDKLRKWSKMTLLISDAKIDEQQRHYRRMAGEFAQIDKEYHRWKGTGKVSELKSDAEPTEVPKYTRVKEDK